MHELPPPLRGQNPPYSDSDQVTMEGGREVRVTEDITRGLTEQREGTRWGQTRLEEAAPPSSRQQKRTGTLTRDGSSCYIGKLNLNPR
jgi:hypothetical protein